MTSTTASTSKTATVTDDGITFPIFWPQFTLDGLLNLEMRSRSERLRRFRADRDAEEAEELAHEKIGRGEDRVKAADQLSAIAERLAAGIRGGSLA